LGEKVPAKPPDSFQTTTSALGQLPAGRLAPAATQMPMSWLKPASKVQRSALAESTVLTLLPGDRVSASALGSTYFQVAPSLPWSRYCSVLDVLLSTLLPSGRATVSRVGE
jgi:hypothetical protein